MIRIQTYAMTAFLVSAMSTWAVADFGTTFTYQGRLQDNGAPVNGAF